MEERDTGIIGMEEYNEAVESERGDRWESKWAEEDVQYVRAMAEYQVSKGRKVSVKGIARKLDDEYRGSLDFANHTDQGHARIRHILRGGTFKHITAQEIGTRRKGGRKPKISVEQVTEIVQDYNNGVTQGELAKRFSVTTRTISRLIKKSREA